MDVNNDLDGTHADESTTTESSPPTAAAARRFGSRLDFGVGIVFVALGIFVFWGSRELPTMATNGPGAGFMTRVAAGLLIILGIIHGARQFGRHPSKTTVAEALPKPNWRAFAALLLLLVIALTYVPLGFLISTVLMMGVLVIGLERKVSVTAILVVVLVPLGFWMLFYHVLGVPLPTGILSF